MISLGTCNYALQMADTQQITRGKNLNQQATKSMRLIYALTCTAYCILQSVTVCQDLQLIHMSNLAYCYVLPRTAYTHKRPATPCSSPSIYFHTIYILHRYPSQLYGGQVLMHCASPVLRITSIWCGPRHDESVQCLGTRHDFGWVYDDVNVCFFVGIFKGGMFSLESL